MDQNVNEIRAARWKAIILEVNNSGMRKREWCRQHGIPERRFYYWQRKLRAAEVSRIQSAAALVPETSTGLCHPELSFAELKAPDLKSPMLAPPALVPSASALPAPAAADIVIEVDRYRLLIGSKITEKTLRTVMKVILNA